MFALPIWNSLDLHYLHGLTSFFHVIVVIATFRLSRTTSITLQFDSSNHSSNIIQLTIKTTRINLAFELSICQNHLFLNLLNRYHSHHA